MNKANLTFKKLSLFSSLGIILFVFFASCVTHRHSALSRKLFVKAGKHQRQSDFYASNRSVKNQQHNNYSKNNFKPIKKQVDAPQLSENEQDIERYEANFQEESSNFEKNELKNNQQSSVLPIHKLDKKNRKKKEKPISEKLRLLALWLFLSSISLTIVAIMFLFLLGFGGFPIAALVLIVVAFFNSLATFIISMAAFHYLHKETTDKKFKRKFYAKSVPVMVFAGIFTLGLVFLVLIAGVSL